MELFSFAATVETYHEQLHIPKGKDNKYYCASEILDCYSRFMSAKRERKIDRVIRIVFVTILTEHSPSSYSGSTQIREP